LVTFIIPIRHPQNAPEWARVQARLAQTMKSIASQKHGDWRAVIVANHGAELPQPTAGFHIERVDFMPNPLHELESANREAVYEAVRLDKGRRILKGMLAAGESRFFMVVDDDDFVSCRLVEFVARSPDANGWNVAVGYRWTDGSRLIYRLSNFMNICGTSHIVRSDLFQLPNAFEDAAEPYIKEMLGSHVKISGILANRGAPLAHLPFPGAIYRVGHAGSHSQSRGVLREHVFNRGVLRRPVSLVRNLSRLRFLTSSLRAEFFGAAS
jgi:hypothetical protein